MDKDNPAFAVPPEMRAFAERNVEQARTAFDGFMSAVRQSIDKAGSAAGGMQSEAREIGAMALRTAERNAANSFAFAQNLVQARDAQEVMRLYTDFVKSQMEALSEQAKDLTDRASKMGGPGQR